MSVDLCVFVTISILHTPECVLHVKELFCVSRYRALHTLHCTVLSRCLCIAVNPYPPRDLPGTEVEKEREEVGGVGAGRADLSCPLYFLSMSICLFISSYFIANASLCPLRSHGRNYCSDEAM